MSQAGSGLNPAPVASAEFPLRALDPWVLGQVGEVLCAAHVGPGKAQVRQLDVQVNDLVPERGKDRDGLLDFSRNASLTLGGLSGLVAGAALGLLTARAVRLTTAWARAKLAPPSPPSRIEAG